MFVMEFLYLIIGVLATSVFFLIRELRLRSRIKKLVTDLEAYKGKLFDEISIELKDQRDSITDFSEFIESTVEALTEDVREQFTDNLSFREDIWNLLFEDENIGDKARKLKNLETELEPSSDEELKQKADDILLKIHKEGINSLSKEEKSILRIVASKGKK